MQISVHFSREDTRFVTIAVNAPGELEGEERLRLRKFRLVLETPRHLGRLEVGLGVLVRVGRLGTGMSLIVGLR